ncbi:MAG: hypothetical protein ACR2PX_12955 [Endozoicomonas sp.]|uniref:hypothetical protein n=1 Tax=Endozoicomonas sp. TaxID=1892382 RepID=UPI003D9B4D30
MPDEEIVRQVASDFALEDMAGSKKLAEAEERKEQLDTGLNLSAKFGFLSQKDKAEWFRKVNEAWERKEKPPWPEPEKVDEKVLPDQEDDEDDDLYS